MDTEHTSGRMGTVPATKFVVLLRVSTKHQGADGLGIAAQKRDIELFLSTQQGAEVIAELTEVESGGSATRPVLEEALHLCRNNKATLLVQKVDRLSRDLETLARIVKDKAVVRKLITACHEIAATGYGDYGDLETYLDQAEASADHQPHTSIPYSISTKNSMHF